MEKQKHVYENNKLVLKCVTQIKASINVDCVKVCPMEKELWAFSFYQQHPEFVGGLQILTTSELESINNQFKLGNQNGYIEIGPIMHIEWLNINPINKYHKGKKTENYKYYLLAAHRCDQAIILSYEPNSVQLSVEKQILLQKGIFCLYCDWKLVQNKQTKQNLLESIAIVSSNQSSVFCFTIIIHQYQIKVGQKTEYNKHENAVWACKLSPKTNYIVVGDEVNCLYLYNINNNELMGKNNKAHEQGICQVVWKDNQKVLSGSFDGSLAEISTQNFNEVLRKFKIGGTIWRIIPIIVDQENYKETFLICNSSQNQFSIYELQSSKIIWKSGNKHKSLAYAADYSGRLFVTASFYDQMVVVWK